MKQIALLLSLAGCHLVFGADGANPTDGSAPCEGPTHDEDGDGFLDQCDNCPGTANADQRDLLEADGGFPPDSVGDVCDPHPDVIGDRLARFITFREPNADLRWPPEIEGWEVDSGIWSPTAPRVT